MSSRSRTVAWAGVLVAAACSREERLPPRRAEPAPAAAPPTAEAIAAATSALSAYLDASIDGSTTHAALDSLTKCPGEIGATPGPMLARYALLDPAVRDNGIVGRAVVTTVAEQDADRQHPGYFVARQRVRSDTLEWDILQSAQGSYTICNGIRFGFVGADSLTSWRPAGASRASARTLADSIAAVR